MDERRDDWRILEREQKIIQRKMHAFDVLLRGDPEKDTDGIIARLHTAENEIQLLKAAVFKDKAGNKGLQGRVDDLESGERSSERRLKIWIAVISLFSAGLVTAMANIDRVHAFLRPKPSTLEKMIEKAKHPKGKPHYVYRVRQAENIEDAPED